MRLFLHTPILLASFFVSTAVLLVSPASSGGQRIPRNLPACDGSIAVVRLSQIKPHGMLLFRQAAAAQQAWYRHNGVPADQVLVAPVYVRNPRTGLSDISETEAYTFHINPPSDPTLPRGDASWKRFVDMYNSSSTMESERVICLPRFVP